MSVRRPLFLLQDQAIKEYADRLDAAERAAKQLARRQESLLKDRISAVSIAHRTSTRSLLSSLWQKTTVYITCITLTLLPI